MLLLTPTVLTNLFIGKRFAVIEIRQQSLQLSIISCMTSKTLYKEKSLCIRPQVMIVFVLKEDLVELKHAALVGVIFLHLCLDIPLVRKIVIPDLDPVLTVSIVTSIQVILLLYPALHSD
jgi:hypothetical protein